MSKIDNAIYSIQSLDAVARKNQEKYNIHPLSKLLVTLFYIVTVVSFNKYNLLGLASLLLYPFIIFSIWELSFKDALHRLRIVLPVVCIVGIFNPFFDHKIIMYIGNIKITGGLVSMITLMLKGICTIFASYILIATTTIDKICYALRCLHVPKIFVTQLLLIYRYISVLMVEANKITKAYELRAPGQKGIHYKVWGSLIGQLLLRTMDRADTLYESMCLRGYNGEFYFGSMNKSKITDWIYTIFWIILFCILRFFPVFNIVGNLIV